jgi:hypothetical protein
MSIEQSLYELTVAVNKLTMTLEKYNHDLDSVKTDADVNTEAEPIPTPIVKPVKKVIIPAPIATADEPVGTAMNVVEMRDTIRTMCSELSQSDKKNKAGIEAIFANYKATHLRMVDDATVPALYAELMTFKGSL